MALLPKGEISFKLSIGIIVNLLALTVFILLSIYPKKYYLISQTGISYHKKDGTKIWDLNWESIIKMEYYSAGIFPIPAGAEIVYKEFGEEKLRAFQISYKDYVKVKNTYKVK